MAKHTQPRPGPVFRTQLENGQVVEADGSTVIDPATESQVPAVLLRMTPERAHILAHMLDGWCRARLALTAPRAAEVSERALAWALENGAAALGDAVAMCCPGDQPEPPSPAQRLAAVSVLRERESGITPAQGIAVVDAAARWLAEDNGEELAQALLQVTARDPITANFVYLALISPAAHGR